MRFRYSSLLCFYSSTSPMSSRAGPNGHRSRWMLDRHWSYRYYAPKLGRSSVTHCHIVVVESSLEDCRLGTLLGCPERSTLFHMLCPLDRFFNLHLLIMSILRYGPSVFNCNGSLVGWTSISRLPHIAAPTLVYNGEFDTSRDIGQEPFFKLIPVVRWVTFPNGSHMCHLDGGGLRERVLKVVGEFLVQGTADEKTVT